MKHDTFIILHHTLVMFRKMFFHFVGVEFQHLGALDGRKPTSKEEELRSSWDLMASYGSSRSECLGCHGMACVACVMSCLPLLKFSSTEVEHGLIYHGNRSWMWFQANLWIIICIYIYESRSKWLKTTLVLQDFFCQRCAGNTVKRYGPPQKR